MNRLTLGFLYVQFGGRRIFMIVLCLLLNSCSVTKEKEQPDIQQHQPELKHQQTHDENRSIDDKTKPQYNSTQVNKQKDQSVQPGSQQQTSASNNTSEIKNARTSQEKAAHTEEKLNASLRDFDELLLKKNDELSKMSKRGGGAAGNASANEGGTEESGQGDHSGGGSVSASKGSGQSVASMNKDKNYDNDDVIARQIREAAEKETDPELKKKLWIEYEKYKSGNK